MSLSNGVQNYISKVEEDTLSSYPIMLEETTVDVSDMLSMISGMTEEETNVEERKSYFTSICK